MIYTSLSGKPVVCYKPKPVAPKATLFIIEEYKVCSYLGNYGTGKTVETFSLLPGEKTTITIKTYKEIESKNIVAENFLDSFSTHSAEQLERLVEAESGTSSSNSTQVGASLGSNMQVGGSLSGVSANATTTFNSAFNIATQREANTRLLNSVISTNVREANSNREISISSANESRSLESEENTTVRELQNINYSRVLNFVFRQLSQEYLVITSLDNIKIMYTNCYPESTRIVDLPHLEGLLKEVIEPGFVDTVYPVLSMNIVRFTIIKIPHFHLSRR